MSTIRAVLAATIIAAAPAHAQQPAGHHALVIVAAMPNSSGITSIVLPDYPTMPDCRAAITEVLRQRAAGGAALNTFMYCIPTGATR